MYDIKPPQKARKLPLSQQIAGYSLTPSAHNALINSSRIMSEGQVEEGASPKFDGTTFVEIDLGQNHLDIGIDINSFCELLKRSVLFRAHLLRLARLEAERKCAPLLVGTMFTQTEFRIDGKRLLIDIEIESSLEKLSNETGMIEGDEK